MSSPYGYWSNTGSAHNSLELLAKYITNNTDYDSTSQQPSQQPYTDNSNLFTSTDGYPHPALQNNTNQVPPSYTITMYDDNYREPFPNTPSPMQINYDDFDNALQFQNNSRNDTSQLQPTGGQSPRTYHVPTAKAGRAKNDQKYTAGLNDLIITIGSKFDKTVKKSHNFMDKSKRMLLNIAINGIDKLNSELWHKEKEVEDLRAKNGKLQAENGELQAQLRDTLASMEYIKKENEELQSVKKYMIQSSLVKAHRRNEEACHENEEIQHYIQILQRRNDPLPR